MRSTRSLFNLLLLTFTVNGIHGSSISTGVCRTVPGSQGWPDAVTWAALNSSLEGRLLAPQPPAIVCDKHRLATYDKSACQNIGEKFFSGYFIQRDPVSVYWPNFQADGCLPSAVYNDSTSCNVRPFPCYVVNATKAEHVATAVIFAKRTGVRLSVKGTGHDYAGRGAAPGLLVWTHHIKGIEFHPSFTPFPCGSECKGTTAITVSAGHIFRDVYAESRRHGFIPVAGAEMSVGLGGYLLGGGHSPIGPKYGLAVDHVLEMKVVTPNGDVVTVNKYHHKDLFWALRGGAGSTFGILISATLRTFPTFPATPFLLSFSSTRSEASLNNNSNFYQGLATLYEHIPMLSDNVVGGVFVFGPTDMIAGIDFSGSSKLKRDVTVDTKSDKRKRQSLLMAGQALDRDEKSFKKLIRPLSARLEAISGIKFNMTIAPKADILEIVTAANGAKPMGGINTLVGSRLLNKDALSNRTRLIETFHALQTPPTIISGIMVSGPGVRDALNPEDTSVTPAWRRTYLHTTTGVNWDYRNRAAAIQARKILDSNEKTLRDLAPDMGSYNNEGDAEEPNFQHAFWGDNYARLLQIKDKLDPTGVFFCRGCVGSERWRVEHSGQVCRS